MAKLTEENRKWIIEMYKTGRYTQEDLTGGNITQQAVSHILKIYGLIKPKDPKGKCLACGEKLRNWHLYEICGDPICAKAYGEAAMCRPQDPLRIFDVQQHFWSVVPEWAEVHYKDAGYYDRIKEYSLFNSKREHVGYHWEILKYGVMETSKKTGGQVRRKTSMKPIWDGVENRHGRRKGYRPALDSGHTFQEEADSKNL